MRLKDRVAIITGAGGSLGRGMALRLAEEGARVIVNDKNLGTAQETVGLVTQRGGVALAHGADVTSFHQVADMVDTAIRAWEKIDILVNNAGFPRDALLVKMTEEDWDAVVDLVLKGSFICAKTVAPHMIERKYGKIINISSMSYRGNVGQLNYTSAKAGIVGMTHGLGLELARHNINVNCIAPGLIETPITSAFSSEIKERLIRTIPLRRMGEIIDIANAVLFLASDESKFITRQTIHVSGGTEGF
jgi:NAD(P)-dependent dehydrogenase (short-subunit alcohol dehydrogenase family)